MATTRFEGDRGWTGETDWPSNPFVHYITWDTKDKIRVAFMSIVVAPVRLVLLIATLLTAYLISLITLINRNNLNCVAEPLRGWRKKSKDVCNRFFVFAHVLCGFYRIKVTGNRAEPWEAPILVMAPHSSWIDTLPVAFIGAPSFVGKIGLLKMPIISSIMLATQPIFVDRDCKDSRKTAVDKIQERARLLLENKDNPDGIGWPQIAVFPEATTTNRSQLITFKPGAFLPKLPVQPVCLRWSAKPDSVTWTWEGVGLLQAFWLTLCSLESHLEIEFLPVYVPNEEEKNDAALFARNVRAKMAECLQVPVSEYSMEDAKYLTRNYKPSRSSLLNLFDELQIPYTICDDTTLEEAWTRLKRSRWSRQDYKVTYDEFAQEFLRSPSMPPKLRHVFNIFDWNCSGGFIDLREFIIAQYANTYSYESMKYCFELFREQYSGEIGLEDFVRILRIPYGLSLKQCKKLYEIVLMEVGNDGRKISLGTLQNAAQKREDDFGTMFRFEDNNNR